ncbi:MAG: dephospho-CoA kinase [Synechococcus sp.]|nr:dephospho-CoA kinase [Synechococcus sp.]
MEEQPLQGHAQRQRWRGRQRRIGLTGGIATGKSTVGRLLQERFGLPVLDADLYAREALAAGSAGARAVLDRHGPAVADSAALRTGTEAIDRAALGRIVFADPAERRWLEELVHPLVRERFRRELEQRAEAAAVVLMIPLLFEAGLEGLCGEVWLVDCDETEQRQRLIRRDGLPEDEARRRIAAQWPLERKRALADQVISNRGNAEELLAAVERALATPPPP